MYSRRLTIRSSHTHCNIISTWNGKSRRAPSSARDILERAAITSRVKQSRTLSNQPPDLKFPYALQYNLNMEREIAPGTILSAGYFGARGNHLPREAEQNPFQPASRSEVPIRTAI